MSDERASELVRLAGQRKQERSTWERHWQDIADVLRPQVASFIGNQPNTPGGGDKRTSKMLDAVPPLSLEKHAAVLEAILSPRNSIWSKLATSDDELDEDLEIKRYLESSNKVLFKARYRPGSGLASQLAQAYLDLGAFGTEVMLVNDDLGRQISYRAVGLHKVVIGENQNGAVNEVHRWYEWTADQAVRAFCGDRAIMMGLNKDELFRKMPTAIRTAYEAKSILKHKFLHSVVERSVISETLDDYRGMRFGSCHTYLGDTTVVDEGGYRTMPYCVSRYSKNTDELWGRSPAMLILAETGILNRMVRAVTKGAESQVEPPLMTVDDSLAEFDLSNGAMNRGTLDEQGNELVKPFHTGADVRLGIEFMDQKRAVIREAFLLDVFQRMLEAPQLNQMQIMEIVRDKAALLAPIMGRQQDELFGPMTERELDILAHAGKLPDMPDALIEREGEITVKYNSPMAIAQRAETGVGILRTWEAITPLLGQPEGQEAAQVFDIAATFRELAEINNYPAKAMRSADEVKALKAQTQQANAMAQAVQAAPALSQSLKSMAEAQAAVGPGGLSR